MTIFIDSSVGSKDLIDHAALREVAKKVKLTSGDACFVGNGPSGKVSVGVEWKTTDDYLASLSNGRLQGVGGQLHKMSKCYGVKFLVIYGRIRSFSGMLQVWQGWRAADDDGNRWGYYKVNDRGVKYSYYCNSFTQIQLRADIHCVTLDDKDQLAWWIRYTYDGLNKPWAAHKLFRKLNTSGDKTRNYMLKVAYNDGTLEGNTAAEVEKFILRVKVSSQLEGMSFERAICVARHFDTLESMITADVDDWLKVEKVGKVIAERAVEQCQT